MPDSKNNIEIIDAIIADLKDKFTPNKSLMTAVAEELRASVQNNFSSSNPMHWQQLKPATLKQKRKKGFSESILQAKGNLMNSIQSL
jgi:phage gpG-like protein